MKAKIKKIIVSLATAYGGLSWINNKDIARAIAGQVMNNREIRNRIDKRLANMGWGVD